MFIEAARSSSVYSSATSEMLSISLVCGDDDEAIALL